jgi:hypothetical protein
MLLDSLERPDGADPSDARQMRHSRPEDPSELAAAVGGAGGRLWRAAVWHPAVDCPSVRQPASMAESLTRTGRAVVAMDPGGRWRRVGLGVLTGRSWLPANADGLCRCGCCGAVHALCWVNTFYWPLRFGPAEDLALRGK